jgi:hypothetical protein
MNAFVLHTNLSFTDKLKVGMTNGSIQCYRFLTIWTKIMIGEWILTNCSGHSSKLVTIASREALLSSTPEVPPVTFKSSRYLTYLSKALKNLATRLLHHVKTLNVIHGDQKCLMFGLTERPSTSDIGSASRSASIMLY